MIHYYVYNPQEIEDNGFANIIRHGTTIVGLTFDTSGEKTVRRRETNQEAVNRQARQGEAAGEGKIDAGRHYVRHDKDGKPYLETRSKIEGDFRKIRIRGDRSCISRLQRIMNSELSEGETPSEPVLAKYREALRARLESKRWEVQTSGITVNGVTIRTDLEPKTNLIGAYLKAVTNENLQSVKWKRGRGDWVTLPRTAILQIGEAVFNFIQQCFEREEELEIELDQAQTKNELDTVSDSIEAFELT